MERWRVEDLMELVQAIRLVGPTFTVRRAVQRLERGEITPLEAAHLVASRDKHGAVVHRDKRIRPSDRAR